VETIILFYQHYVREYSAINKLKFFLEKDRYKVYIFSIDFELFKALKIARRNTISVIVTPWMYHKKNYELFVPFINLNNDIIIINLHHEQIASRMTEKILVPQRGEAQDCVYHFVWGEFFKSLLEKNGVDKSLIHITGNMRNDESFFVASNREDFSKHFGLDFNKKWLLFSDNRNWVDYWNNAEKKERLSMGVLESHLDEFYNIAKKSLDITIKEFNQLDSRFFSKYELIYRPHPGSQISNGRIQDKVRIISQKTIYEWLKVVDANIVWGSTTIFESDAMGVPSIVYEPFEYSQIYTTYGINKYYKIKKIAEINEAVLLKALAVQNENKMFQYFYGSIDGQATKRVADSVINLLNNRNPFYRAIPIKYSKMDILRKYLFELMTRFMVKSKLFMILKYPRSAWAQKNDIPYLGN